MSEQQEGGELRTAAIGLAVAAQPRSTSELDPQARQLEATVDGIPISSGGKTWLVARLGLAPVATRQRDRIGDDLTIHSDVSVGDCTLVVWAGLQANYRLAPEEVAGILGGIEPETLADAAIGSVLVHQFGDADRTYTNWARSSLLANGINPKAIAKTDLPHVLRQLVATGRAIPLGEFTAAGEFAAARQNILADE